MAPEPGDIVFCHSSGLIGAAIRLGERLRTRGDGHSYWNHCAIVVDPIDRVPQVVQATNVGMVQTPLSALGIDVVVIAADEFPALDTYIDPWRVVRQANALIGARYGWLTILSIVVNLLTPRWITFPDFRRGSTFICSAAAAYCLHAGGADIDVPDIYSIFPSELRGLIGQPNTPT